MIVMRQHTVYMATFGGIAFPTKVTLGSFLPSVSYVVKLPNRNEVWDGILHPLQLVMGIL